MKGSRLEACISYIRFTLINEGIEPKEFDEELFEDILQEDKTADEVISNYLKKNNLSRQEISTENVFARYPNSRSRVNYFGITKKDVLDDVDRMLSAIRTAELFVSPIDEPLSVEYFVKIHKRMFGDLYPYAGVFRNKNAAKRTEFVPPEMIERMLNEIFEKLEASDYLRKLDEDDDSEDFLNELAYFMGELEAIHPFVDGNGRVIRFFITLIANRAGYYISWGSADPDQLLEASIAAIDGDYQSLVDLLEEITIPLEED